MTISTSPLMTDRAQLFDALAQSKTYDLAVIGGGATGLGVALDAALRGLSVVLLESHDFAKGTSSRATKLLHGGVRYLAQGNISLVYEALHERSAALHNAAHLTSPLPFLVPSYQYWEIPFYGAGLKMYDALAGKAGLGTTQFLSAEKVREYASGIKPQGLKGGVRYWDAQFDDARLALALARTAAQQGALLINYCPVSGFIYKQNKLAGVHCIDSETGRQYSVQAKCVINAAGVWVDHLREQDGVAIGRPTKSMISPSQGVHLVVDSCFWPSNHALLVPRTQDGRILFAVPWLGKVILGTTDTPRKDLMREPDAFVQEVNFILSEAAKYLKHAPTRSDIKSIWAGLRPLVKPPGSPRENQRTKGISREHSVVISASGLVTVTGGKWTTYRAMAQDVLDKCIAASLITPSLPCRTAEFLLVGAPDPANSRTVLTQEAGLQAYGTEQSWVQALEGHDCVLVGGLTEAMLRFATRYEYARSVEDVLARRSRLLFLDAKLAAALAPRVAQIVQEETGVDPKLDSFLQLAHQYQHVPI